MSAPVELVPLQCVKCATSIAAQPDEVLWVCETCGQAQILNAGQTLEPLTIHYSSWLPQQGVGKPVWVAAGSAALQREIYGKIFNGDKTEEMRAFWSVPRWFFIPAYSLPLDSLLQTGVEKILSPQPLQEGGPRLPFLPVTVLPEDVKPLAEFVVLALEADRKDNLRTLNFDLQLQPPELWIFP